MVIVGTVIAGDAIAQQSIYYAKASRKSDKEKSTDKPSWVSRNDVDLSKSAQENAKIIMNNKYGSNWPKGTREYSQIVKWVNRSLKVLTLLTIKMDMEDAV